MTQRYDLDGHNSSPDSYSHGSGRTVLLEQAMELTRRALFAFIPALMDESPKNQLATVANRFNRQFVTWAEAFNKVKPGTIDAAENEAFTPLMETWRKVERLRVDWLRGQ